jgi:hypothetical protein
MLAFGLLACSSPSVDPEVVDGSTTVDGAEVTSSSGPPTPQDVGSSGTVAEESDSGVATGTGDVPPTDGWFAATTRVIFYADQYGAISAHGLAIEDQLSTAPGLVDYTFDFELQSGRAQSISLWESEADFWMFVVGAAHGKAMVELREPPAGRDFSYATWWVETEMLPTRIEADEHLGPEPMPGPYPID